jgi:hypothetical protein
MMALVSAAKRTSEISTVTALGMTVPLGASGLLGEDESSTVVVAVRRMGRHFRTASTEARQGWTWRGYENMTRTTMAARPMVDATAGGSKI